MSHLVFFVVTPTSDLLISCKQHLEFNMQRYQCPLCPIPDAPFVNSYTEQDIKKHLQGYHHLDVT